MKPNFKSLWVAALRSDRYKQGRCALRTIENKFCCLGVALDLKDSTKWHRFSEHSMVFDWDSIYSTQAASDLADELEIPYRKMRELVGMNDSGSFNFHDIADFIEKQL